MQKMRFRTEPLGEPTAFSQIPYFQGRRGEGRVAYFKGDAKDRERRRERRPLQWHPLP